MTQQDYDQKKRECWEYVSKTILTIGGEKEKRAFDYAFDRAYALGKETAKKGQRKEPKYHVGDTVIIHGVNNYLLCGKVGVIEKLPDEIEPFNYKICFEGDKYTYLSESYLKPYTEPQEETATCRKTSQDFDKDFDNIVKQGFQSHNRLHIAAMAMQGILSNEKAIERACERLACSHEAIYTPFVAIAKYALDCADELIEESEKGGSK